MVCVEGATRVTEKTTERMHLKTEGVKPVFTNRYVRFGAFHIDLERERVCQNGHRRKIQAKGYQALLMLVARAGEVVTREEIRQCLWLGQSFKRPEASVYMAMTKLGKPWTIRRRIRPCIATN